MEEQAEQVARKKGAGKTGRPRRTEPRPMTDREREATALARAGLTHAEIGRRMGITRERAGQLVHPSVRQASARLREEKRKIRLAAASRAAVEKSGIPKIAPCHCFHCGHDWTPQRLRNDGELPALCPACHSYKWNRLHKHETATGKAACQSCGHGWTLTVTGSSLKLTELKCPKCGATNSRFNKEDKTNER